MQNARLVDEHGAGEAAAARDPLWRQRAVVIHHYHLHLSCGKDPSFLDGCQNSKVYQPTYSSAYQAGLPIIAGGAVLSAPGMGYTEPIS